MVAELATWATPAGSGLATVTAKVRDPAPPLARFPRLRVQVVPAGEPLAHDQPPLDAPALKVVLAGTVSVRVTPVALPGPALP